MKTSYKIIVIIGMPIIVIVGIILIGPVMWMITVNAYSSFIISTTPDSVFEEEFAKISEVNFFIEKYPNYYTSHSGDFLGWKIIYYTALVDDHKSINLEVKKSILHQGVRISAGCNEGDYSYGYTIPQDQVMDYLKNEECLRK